MISGRLIIRNAVLSKQTRIFDNSLRYLRVKRTRVRVERFLGNYVRYPEWRRRQQRLYNVTFLGKKRVRLLMRTINVIIVRYSRVAHVIVAAELGRN